MSQLKSNIDVTKMQSVRMAKPNWSDTGADWPVYRIKLSELHYNEENGRIASWISSYMSNKDNPALDSLSREDFNDTIEEYIVRANKKEYLDLLINDIKKKTQLNPGVVLTDGTIVSGNRRFTALRNLYRESCDDKYEYFECFVVPTPTEKNSFEFVKLIETKTQFGVVTEVDYDPIDRLVTIYRYLIDSKTKIWSTREYAKKINISFSKAEELYYRAAIMVDYLEYIQQPLEFHVARIQKLDGPIAELPSLYKQLVETPQGKAEWNRIRPLFYSEFPPKRNKDDSKDRTRKVRSLKKMYNDNKQEFENLLSRLYEEAEKIEEKAAAGLTTTTNYVQDGSGNVRVGTSLDSQVIQDAINETNKLQAKEKPIKKTGDALKLLREIDSDVFRYMDTDDKTKLTEGLDAIVNEITNIKNKMNNR